MFQQLEGEVGPCNGTVCLRKRGPGMQNLPNAHGKMALEVAKGNMHGCEEKTITLAGSKKKRLLRFVFQPQKACR